ncbi:MULTISPECIES: DUF4254 domain-containing protein [Proteiniphilum]|jgi:hypothetical protein|uniref:DUF4254 domain-containing protein n=1 Tax=Proteiniphilum TaxID=294702 RepID=UPI001EEBCC61|nr:MULTISPECIES: DUF4254 domain-containing protein [Proteiniphilum]ULB33904.1 DUF4254 domain-containing protein [Proteiniphilum propionicum]
MKRNFCNNANLIFDRATEDYHIKNDVTSVMNNPFQPETIDNYLYEKNWIDVVQWHLEDIIRDPEIDPVKALEIKRWIDRSNQERTDLVEKIDTYFYHLYNGVKTLPNASINTESPAWAIDRLSILAVKIYHMREQTLRIDTDPDHLDSCRGKLDVLLEQRVDLSSAIDNLLDEIKQGKKYMKVYRQMKMYNDPSLNPVLYAKNVKKL